MKYLLILTALLLLLLLLLPGIHDEILYSKGSNEDWLPFIITFLGIPFFIYKTLQEYKKNQNLSMTVALFFLLIMIPLFGFWAGGISDNDLEKNGKIQTAVVAQRWYVTNQKYSPAHWNIRAEFKVGNNIFLTYSKTDEENKIRVGDSVVIRYSTLNPHNSKILRKIWVQQDKINFVFPAK